MVLRLTFFFPSKSDSICRYLLASYISFENFLLLQQKGYVVLALVINERALWDFKGEPSCLTRYHHPMYHEFLGEGVSHLFLALLWDLDSLHQVHWACCCTFSALAFLIGCFPPPSCESRELCSSTTVQLC